MAPSGVEPDSNVDLIAEIDRSITFSLLDVIGLGQDAAAHASAVRGRSDRGLIDPVRPQLPCDIHSARPCHNLLSYLRHRSILGCGDEAIFEATA